MFKTFLCCVVLLFAINVAPSPAGAQQDDIRRIEDSITRLNNNITDKLTKLDSRIGAKEAELYEFKVNVYAVVSSLLGIAGLMGLKQLFSRNASARREQIVNEMLQLIKTGEDASQKRAAELHNVMLEEGRITLNLVNDTLRLAKQSSEGAVNALKNRVSNQLADFDREASAFLVDFTSRDTRDIINKRDNRDKVRSLIQELTAFEHNNAVLQEQLKLTPNCLFIKALQLHIDSHFSAAIETLREVIAFGSNDRNLVIHSWYWIGYEQNSIGAFDQAETSLATAIAETSGERKLMLERLQIEAMLSNRSKYKATQLIDNINRVMKSAEIQDCSEDGRDMIAVTKAVILYAAALEVYDEGKGDKDKAKTYLREILKTLQPQIDHGGKPLAIREYAFASLMLQENVKEAKQMLPEVRKHARQEVADRIGARHKAASNAVLLIVAKELGLEDRIAPLDVRVTHFVSEVHDRVMIYSPLKKRSVPRAEFLNDVHYIAENGLPRIV